MTDEELVRGCINKDEKYQKILWDTHAPKLLTVCRRYCKDLYEAEDVLMETMVKVYNNLGSFRGESKLSTYLRRITINMCLNKIRSRKETVSLDSIDFSLGRNSWVIEKLAAEDILKLVNELPEGYKQVFNLYAIDGYSHREIAEMLEIQEVTSRTQFSKARKALQAKLVKTQKQELND
jgi:RNA polymerase sigma factor (sigma-70 family)